MTTCGKCGGGMVCPKCTPVIEHTNSIIVRYKDTAYNGGYPNSLIIAPVYTHPTAGHVSVAILTGDNFYEGFTFYDSQSVEGMANFIAHGSIDAFMQMFNLKKTQKKPAVDLLESLRHHLAGEST